MDGETEGGGMINNDLSIYGIDMAIAEDYAESLRDHIKYVREAGEMIGVLPEQLEVHDESKWSVAEFRGYAMHFKGGGAPDEFAAAWLHHIHANPHHWQHWTFSDGYTPKGSSVENGAVEMPKHYALEMVADRMGAEMTYGGSWDMTDWLQKIIPRIRVHSRTAIYLREVLDGLGYADVIYKKEFAK